MLGIAWDRPTLYERIDKRIDAMIAGGLIEETERALATGLTPDRPALSSLGYRQIVDYLQGTLTLEAAIERIKFETHRFARQQSTWFRSDDPSIHWLRPDETLVSRASELVEGFLRHVGGVSETVHGVRS